MRLLALSLAVCTLATAAVAQQTSTAPDRHSGNGSYLGFDTNIYPGDDTLPALRRHFGFVSFWLNTPPGEHANNWKGKRDALLKNGFGFLVLDNGRFAAEIGRAKKRGITPAALGEKDASEAVATAHREGFPAHTIIFLDQEEGGRLTADQAGYLFAWTEAIARSGYLPGAYASGQPVGDGPGQTITTVQNIRDVVASKHLHEIAVWVYQDACPPANGCSMQPPPLEASGTRDVAAWQYAQSPRRKDITAACSKTYAKDGNCYAPDLPAVSLDLNVAPSADPSHGR